MAFTRSVVDAAVRPFEQVLIQDRITLSDGVFYYPVYLAAEKAVYFDAGAVRFDTQEPGSASLGYSVELAYVPDGDAPGASSEVSLTNTIDVQGDANTQFDFTFEDASGNEQAGYVPAKGQVYLKVDGDSDFTNEQIFLYLRGSEHIV